MLMRFLFTIFGGVLTFILIQPAFADRAPTPEERGRIEQKLRSLGFQSWGEIELDDGRWEVEDARRGTGEKKYELNLKFDTLEIIKQEEDD